MSTNEKPLVSLRRWSLLALLFWSLAIGLLWLQHQRGVLHPYALLFLALLLGAVVSSLLALVRGYWRVVRGPHRTAALVWSTFALVPVLLVFAWTKYLLNTSGRLDSPNNLAWHLGVMATASLMETQAVYTSPQRYETEHLVMFHEGVATPRADAEAMEEHVARLEQLTGKPLRAKIYWVRGRLLGRGRMACYGLALGSTASPSDWTTADHPDGLSVDRHELAHAVLHQQYQPDTDPPTLLVEGWAESQAGPSSRRLAQWALESRQLWRERTGAGVDASYLQELVGPARYHHIDGAVYSVGGAFADHVIRRYGAERFLRLYFACRPGTFAAECRAALGMDLETLENEFWAEAEHSNERN